MKKLTLIIFGYFVVIAALFLYSYTQVDLSLTLSRASIYQTIEKYFQYIGYFNRPLSTYIFCAIIISLFIFYGIFLLLAKQKKITISVFWKIIIPVSFILALSYNAFSYDLFNYIFYTKIILHYHQNPYFVTALDFPKDPMLSFMHWTHNTYPYGPFWLVLTVPLGFLGLNYFLTTFFLFKVFSAFCFIGTVYFVNKILKKIAPDYSAFGTIFYALNPLVLIESLVSAHNDVAMIFLAVIGFYFLIEKKWILGTITVILSVLTKQATVFLLLPFLLYSLSILTKKKFFSEKWFIKSCALVTVLGFFAVITKIEIQPWYLLWFLPFVIFAKPQKLILWLVCGFTLGTLLRYVPFLWQGDWNGQASFVKLVVTVSMPVVFLILGILFSFKAHAKK